MMHLTTFKAVGSLWKEKHRINETEFGLHNDVLCGCALGYRFNARVCGACRLVWNIYHLLSYSS